MLDDLANILSLGDVNEAIAPDLASLLCKHIISRINEFEKDIPDNMQAGGRFVSTNDGFTFSIDDVGYSNPNLLVFYGHSNGYKVRLLQHIMQLNLLLVAVPRTDDLSKPRRKIGFQFPE